MAAALQCVALASFPACLSSSSSSKFPSTKLSIFYTCPSLSLKSPFSPTPIRKLGSQLCSAVSEASVEEEAQQAPSEEDDETKLKRRLFVYNLSRSLDVEGIRNIFSECGTVTDVEIIGTKGHISYTFVTMASPDQARAAIQKFHSKEVAGRVLDIQLARKLGKSAR